MELQWHGLFAAPVKVQAVEDMGKDNTLTLECRFYGPEKAIFDKDWRLPDIERVN
jgi:hypothetical protein